MFSYTIRWARKLTKYLCSQCTEDADNGDKSLIKNMYDQRHYSSRRLDVESGSSGSNTPAVSLFNFYRHKQNFKFRSAILLIFYIFRYPYRQALKV